MGDSRRNLCRLHLLLCIEVSIFLLIFGTVVYRILRRNEMPLVRLLKKKSALRAKKFIILNVSKTFSPDKSFVATPYHFFQSFLLGIELSTSDHL